MKVHCWMALLAMVGVALGQGIPLRPIETPKPVPATDLPVLRVVNGQLYNTQRSVLWEHLRGTCAGVLTNGVILEEVKIAHTYGSGHVGEPGAYGSHREVLKTERVPGKLMFIRNYPASLAPTDGAWLYPLAMKLGTCMVGDATMELWDYGTPYDPRAPSAGMTLTNAPGGTNSPAR